jgi:hypothetical protein
MGDLDIKIEEAKASYERQIVRDPRHFAEDKAIVALRAGVTMAAGGIPRPAGKVWLNGAGLPIRMVVSR